jgi:hypothetical protein
MLKAARRKARRFFVDAFQAKETCHPRREA